MFVFVYLYFFMYMGYMDMNLFILISFYVFECKYKNFIIIIFECIAFGWWLYKQK